MDEEEIETINDCMVAVGGVDGEISILRPPVGPMTKEQALRLAAWLVVLADPLDRRFPAVRAAIAST